MDGAGAKQHSFRIRIKSEIRIADRGDNDNEITCNTGTDVQRDTIAGMPGTENSRWATK